MNISVDSEDLADLINKARLYALGPPRDPEPSTALEDLATVNHQEMVWRKWGEAIPTDRARTLIIHSTEGYDFATAGEFHEWRNSRRLECSELHTVLPGGLIWMYAPKVPG